MNSFMWKNFANDSLKYSYHIFNDIDTVSFDLNTLNNVKYRLLGGNKYFKCLELQIIERGHNYCTILRDSIPFSGNFKRRIVGRDSTVNIFSGVLKNGLIEKGSFIKFHSNGRVMMTGQYYNNWKFGIWSYYYESGELERVVKYVEGADYPVVEFEYERNLNLEYFNDEEFLMEQLIKKENERK